MKQITGSFKAFKALKHVQSVNFITCRTGKANVPVRKFHLSNAHVGLHEGSSLYDYRLQKEAKTIVTPRKKEKGLTVLSI